MKNILMLAGDFSEDCEVMVSYQALGMLELKVGVTCPGKKAGDLLKTAIHDFAGDQIYAEKPGHLFRLTTSFLDVDPENRASRHSDLGGGERS